MDWKYSYFGGAAVSLSCVSRGKRPFRLNSSSSRSNNVLVVYVCVCVLTDSPGRDPNVISTSSQRSQSAMGGIETGHKALVLKVHLLTYHIYSAFYSATLR